VVVVYLTVDDQSTSSSWNRAPLWGPWPDCTFILSLWQLLCCSSCRAPSLTRGRVCNLQCNRWLVKSLRTNNHTLPSHLRLCSIFVDSYDSQGLRWNYSNPPLHGVVFSVSWQSPFLSVGNSLSAFASLSCIHVAQRPWRGHAGLRLGSNTCHILCLVSSHASARCVSTGPHATLWRSTIHY
jgi:hypothetical protein